MQEKTLCNYNFDGAKFIDFEVLSFSKISFKIFKVFHIVSCSNIVLKTTQSRFHIFSPFNSMKQPPEIV